MATTKRVWKGGAQLRRLLVPIDSLEPFPGNPRQGDVGELVRSLKRFGQVKPILVDGSRIIAGHHVRLATIELGWTHIAVVQNEFQDEAEQRAYLMADNRLGDLGGYDTELMMAQLRALAEGDLAGTGYDTTTLDEALAKLREMAATEPVIAAERGQRQHRDPGMKELVLTFNEAQFAQAEVWLGVIAKEKGTAGTSETVFEGLRVAAQHLNG